MNNTSGMDYKYWSKKILEFYWLIIAITIFGQFIGLLLTIYFSLKDPWEFIGMKILLPTSFQLIVMLICIYFTTIKKIYSPKLLMVTGTLVALVIIVIHDSVPGLQVLLLLPMSVALIFFEKKSLRFSFIINIIALISVYLLPSVRASVTEFEFSSYLLGLVAGYVIFLAILQRGHEVLRNLHLANEKEKELIAKSAMMERLSKVDALTGLYNHKTFYEYLEDLVEQSKVYSMQLQLAILDIDNFKGTNDMFGHNVGDIVLRRVAEAIVQNVSENDIVARYGGEEFAIILTNKSLEEAYQVVEQARQHISTILHSELNETAVTVSIGLKNYQHPLTRLSLFKQADALLYEAKRSGKNKVVFSK
ncbi:GGDEF domain-containing protein [Bacillus suaedae]|uniref:GGDEF domain-containing protein n=1 Tax=Halalkalibacter suaedae TaxID=2822140 RepID=A0A941AQT0_9BACI|nr:GGDEF domain-containing protein [Bacillus suaedae]MBP3951583.1 GGDEF domain-containing protein [Bacillus suaedae]